VAKAKPQHTRRLLSQQPPPALFAPRCAQRPPLSPRASRSPTAVFRPFAVLSVSIAAIDPRLSSAVRGPHLRRRASEISPQSYTSRPTLSPQSTPRNHVATSPTSLTDGFRPSATSAHPAPAALPTPSRHFCLSSLMGRRQDVCFFLSVSFSSLTPTPGSTSIYTIIVTNADLKRPQKSY